MRKTSTATPKSILDTRLTSVHSNNNQIANSFPGMAHFAGTGPSDKDCIHCAFWHSGKTRRLPQGYQNGSPAVAICAKFLQVTKLHTTSKKVPKSAKACRYFEEWHGTGGREHG